MDMQVSPQTKLENFKPNEYMGSCARLDDVTYYLVTAINQQSQSNQGHYTMIGRMVRACGTIMTMMRYQ
jgi:3-methyladenine DNA glycosylase/8-oxoguanine DNA glycosylase